MFFVGPGRLHPDGKLWQIFSPNIKNYNYQKTIKYTKNGHERLKK